MSKNSYHIIISISQQKLFVLREEAVYQSYMIATAKNGIGQIEGSECTPLGKHRIAEKIGDNAPENAVFIGRQWQQEIYDEQLAKSQSDRDWILTRILWLDGLEAGYNSGLLKTSEQTSCDTKSRYIYIHGCPNSHPMQIPSSHGCIKMRNADVIELFNMIDVNTKVLIQTEALT